MIKKVVNDNGGTAAPSDFTLSVNATDPTPASFKGADTPGVEVTLAPGAYSVAETGGPTGYTGSFSAACTGTIALGETKTCTVTNNDQPAKLIVKKIVINDNGGTKTAADFSFKVNNGSATAFEADGQNDLTVNAGTLHGHRARSSRLHHHLRQLRQRRARQRRDHDLHDHQQRPAREADRQEDRHQRQRRHQDRRRLLVQGQRRHRHRVRGRRPERPDRQRRHTTRSPSPQQPATPPPTTTATTSHIANGGTATCTITNNDQPAKLIVKKIVINDNGGTKIAADFSFQVNGGSATSFEADGQNDLTVDAGSYSVTEPAAAGYTTTYDNCDNVALANGGHRDLHDHQQRPAREADRDQARRQRQRRQGGRVRLHAVGRRDEPDAGFVQGRRRPGRRGVTRAGRVQRQRDGRPDRVHRQLLGRLQSARSRSARPRPARSRTTTSPRS